VSIRSLILALASGAVFAAAALAPVGASAKPMGVIIKPSPGPMGVIIKPSPGPMGVVKPVFGVKPVLGVIIPPKPIITGIVIHPPGDHDHDHGWWWWHHHHEHPWIVEGGYPVSAPVAVTGPVATVTGPANGPCTCLTKTYLTDGSVKFTDVCTKETAVATPDDLRAQR
jgi:hypothetical protein